MTAVVRGTLLGFLVFSVACGDGQRITVPSSAPTPASRYDFSQQPSYPVSSYTAASRYVLRGSGSFSLQYPTLGSEYVGTYSQQGDSILFRFATDGRWDATGTLNGDSLEVRYNVIMELTDFENAVYSRSQ
jgi:hypothetical protein